MTQTYSHENHFKWIIDPAGRYRVEFGHSTPNSGTFREEVCNAARLISRKADEEGLPVLVYMSGGQDSEVMARGFLEAGLPFKACILQYEDNRNQHDIKSAIEFCNTHGVGMDIVNFNLHEFLVTQYVALSKKYECPDVSIMTHVWCIENLAPHFPVIGGGDLEFIRKRHNQSWWSDDLVRVEKTQSLAPIKALQAQGRSGATRFFSYTPELMFAYLTHPLLRLVMQNEKSFNSWWEREWKSIVYHDQYPDLKPRQKYDGFEKAPEAYPVKWFYSKQLNPVTDDAAALAVSQALYATTRKVLATELTVSQLLTMVQPACPTF